MYLMKIQNRVPWCACLICAILLTVIESPEAHCQDESFHVFSINKKTSSLESLEVRSTAGEVELKRGDTFSLPLKPTGLCVTPKNEHLLVTGRGDDGQSQVLTVHWMGRDDKSNHKTDGNQFEIQGSSRVAHSTGYTSVDRSGNFYLSADYRAGVVVVHRLNENSVVGKETSIVELPKKSAHCILTTPDNRFTYVPCVKDNNAIFQFSFNEKSGKLTPLEPFNAAPPAMFGPRHAAYHPNLPIVYFSNEQQLGVSVYRISGNGGLNDIQHVASLARRAPYQKGKRGLHASDLAMSADSQWLFVAVRDFQSTEDSIFSYKVAADGRLALAHRKKVGNIPWKINLSPSGRFLITSEIGDRQLSVYKVQPGGELTDAARVKWDMEIRNMVVLDRN